MHPKPFRCTFVHLKEKTSTLLIITWYCGRNCTKLVFKNSWQPKIASLFQSCVLLFSCILYYFSVHDGYPPFLYTAWSVYIAGSPFLMKWNKKRCSKLQQALVLENSSSAVVYTLPNTIIYLKAMKYLNITLGRKIH